ncbi:MAG: polysaccharide deacetylase family protein [Anaerolineales bacterium]|nr:polysaccharide deacetylase family protein [Anaerolineales bacterium]
MSKHLFVLLALACLLSACTLLGTHANSPQATASITPSPFAPRAATLTPSASPTLAASSTPTITPTPAPLPASFPGSLRAGVQPVAYIADQCTYLAQRWDPANSQPGTVVAPLMYHSILRGNAVPSLSQDINEATFYAIVDTARRLGFETITSQQLADFLLHNAPIPPRSMLLILDDRRPGTAQEYFLPLYEQYGWGTTLGWIIGDTDSRTGEHSGESLWTWIERLNDTGVFDVQSHGLNHIPVVGGLSTDFLRSELGDNIPLLEQHFGQRPIAHIWAGGNFTADGVAVAEELGYTLAFTVYSRGPIMFNWIPQGEQERAIGNPLLLLPRYWNSAAELNLQQAADANDAARQFARENYAAEAAWFSQNCGGELAPLDAVFDD